MAERAQLMGQRGQCLIAPLLGDRCRLIRGRVSEVLRQEPGVLEGVTQVYHLAASVGVQLVAKDPAAIIRNNTEETAALFEATHGSDATVLGYRCSRIALHADGQAIGEACVAPATSVSGGAAVLQMLQAMAAVLDRLREWPDTPVYLAWPSHPLVAAARSGQLPLQVIQHAPGGVRHQLQLDAVQPLPSIPVSGP